MSGVGPRFIRRIPLYVQILIGMTLGIFSGMIFGEGAAVLGELGALVIRLIKTLAAPLLFFAIMDAFLKATVRWRQASWMVTLSAINGALSLIVGLSISNILRPGESLRSAVTTTAEPSTDKIDFVKALSGHVPTSAVGPFVENAIIPIIMLAVIGGLALRRVREERRLRGDPFPDIGDQVVSVGYRVFEIAVIWIVKLIPLAVFGVVAHSVGKNGFSSFKGLAVYLGVGLLGLFFQIGVVYQGWLVLFSGMSLRKFWSHARDAAVYSLGACSSLATLPLTLSALDRMGVSRRSSRLVACVGTNLNQDGIFLYEALAVLLVAQAHGIDLSLSQQLVVAVSCVVAGVGIAGVPEAGFISLSLVLTTVGIPTEILPHLLTVDWVLSRVRALTNVINDMVISILLDRFSPPTAEELESGLEIAAAGTDLHGQARTLTDEHGHKTTAVGMYHD